MFKRILNAILNRPITTKLKIVERDPSQIRMREWRADPAMCDRAAAVLRDPVIRQMLDVVRNEHPNNDCFTGEISLKTRAVWQARGQGYTEALANLEALAIFWEPQSRLPSTYGAAVPRGVDEDE